MQEELEALQTILSGLQANDRSPLDAFVAHVQSQAQPNPASQSSPVHLHTQAKLDGIAKPPMFSGERNAKSMRPPEWLFRATKFARFKIPALGTHTATAFDHHNAIEMTASYLEDCAWNWWRTQHDLDTMTHSFLSFETFCQALQQEFAVATDENRIRDKLQSISQTTSVLAYTSLFNTTLNELYAVTGSRPESADLVHRYVSGLQDPHIRFELRRDTPATLQSAMSAALALDDALFASRPSGAQASNNSNSSHVDQTAMDLNAVSPYILSSFTPGSSSRSSAPRQAAGHTPFVRAAPTTADHELLERLQSSKARLTDDEKDHLTRLGACWYCRVITDHHARDCPTK